MIRHDVTVCIKCQGKLPKVSRYDECPACRRTKCKGCGKSFDSRARERHGYTCAQCKSQKAVAFDFVRA